MKRLAIVLLLLAFGMELKAQLPRYLWAKGWGSSGITSARTMVVDGSGNAIVGGEFGSTVDFDPGPGVFNVAASGIQIAYLLKLGPTGTFTWAIRLDGRRATFLSAVTTDGSGNIFACGHFVDTMDVDPGTGVVNVVSKGKSDGYVIKISPGGGLIWYKQFEGGGSNNCTSLALDKKGNIYCTGTFDSTVDFDPGAGTYSLPASGVDAFVCKLDTGGNFVWARKTGGTDFASGNQIALDSSANAYVTGIIVGTADMDPGVGVSNFTAVGKQDAFLLKLDAAGNYLWANIIGDTADEYHPYLAVAQNGSVYLGGTFEGSIDFDPGPSTYRLTATPPFATTLLPIAGDMFLLKLNAAGKFQWAHRFGNKAWDGIYSLIVDSKNYVYVAGEFMDTVDFDPGPLLYNMKGNHTDIFVSKMDSLGRHVWGYHAGGSAQDAAIGIALAPNGDVFACGWIWSASADFDQTAGSAILKSHNPDAFVVRLSQVKGEPGSGVGGGLAGSDGLLVYPNPTKGVVTIKALHDMRDGRVRLYSMSGQSIREYVWNSGREFVVDVRDVAAGVYFVEVSSDGGEVYRGRVLMVE